MDKSVILPSAPGSRAALWLGWLAAPAWWLIQFEARYALVPWACSHGHRWAILGTGVGALGVSVILTLWAWRVKSETAEQPHAFLRTGSAWCTTFFALLVLAQMLPDLFLNPCTK